MGEIVELISEGVLCESCGCLIDDLVPEDDSNELLTPPGHARLCKECEDKLKAESL